MSGFSEKDIKEIIGKEETEKKEKNYKLTAVIATCAVIVAVILAIVIPLSTLKNDETPNIGGNKHNVSPITDFEYSISDGYATISKYIGNEMVVVIPEVIEGAPVKHIGECAFSENKTVTEIAMPDGVISIGEQAFSNMGQLSKITLPDSLETIGIAAFRCCYALKEINLPERLVNIDAAAFETCTALEKITLPESITVISPKCFYNCKSLASVEISSKTTAIHEAAFYDCKMLSELSLPDTVSYIGNSAFAGTALTSFEIPPMVTEIPDSMLAGCQGLTEVIFNDSITKIGNSAFYLTALKSVALPETVTEIGDNCFGNCLFITDIILPDSVTKIGRCAFENCEKLVSVKLSENLSSIPDATFNGCSSIAQIDIPESVKSIGNSAFANCSKLSVLELPKNLEELYTGGTFHNCKELTEIRIPESLTSFSYADDLDPANLTIGFISGTNNLKAIYLPKTFYDENIGLLLKDAKTPSLYIFESGNENYTIKDGKIYNRDMNVLIYADTTNEKENDICKYFEIPDNVEFINKYALSGFSSHCYILMPDEYDDELPITQAKIVTEKFFKGIILSVDTINAEINETIADAYLEIKKTDSNFCTAERVVISKLFPDLILENSIFAYISTETARKHTVHIYPVSLESKFETLENISDSYGQYLETPKTYYSEMLGEYRIRFSTTASYSDRFIDTSALVDHFLIADVSSVDYFKAKEIAAEIYERDTGYDAYNVNVIEPIRANWDANFDTLILECWNDTLYRIELYPSGYYGDNGETVYTTENGKFEYSVRLIDLNSGEVYY